MIIDYITLISKQPLSSTYQHVSITKVRDFTFVKVYLKNIQWKRFYNWHYFRILIFWCLFNPSLGVF